MNRVIEKKHIAVPLSRFSWPGKIRRLAVSECPAFFPADLCVKNEMVHILFHTEGCRPLRDMPSLKSTQGLEILKELIQHLSAARDWMWYPEELVISFDTVWIGTDGHVRLLCIPDSQELSLYRRLNLFTESLKKTVPEYEKDILSELQSQWMDRPHPVHRILGAIDRMILELQEYSSYHFIK